MSDDLVCLSKTMKKEVTQTIIEDVKPVAMNLCQEIPGNWR